MTDEEFLRIIGEIRERVMAAQDDNDFEPNKGQLEKLMKVYSFFKDIGAEIEIESMLPRECHSGVTAYITVSFRQEHTEYRDYLRYRMRA